MCIHSHFKVQHYFLITHKRLFHRSDGRIKIYFQREMYFFTENACKIVRRTICAPKRTILHTFLTVGAFKRHPPGTFKGKIPSKSTAGNRWFDHTDGLSFPFVLLKTVFTDVKKELSLIKTVFTAAKRNFCLLKVSRLHNFPIFLIFSHIL